MDNTELLNKIYSDVQSVKREVENMQAVLKDNTSYGTEGIISQVNKNTHYLRKIERHNLFDRLERLENECEKTKKSLWAMFGGLSVIVAIIELFGDNFF